MRTTCGEGSTDGYPDSADNNAAVITIIEEARAMENVEALAATAGTDVLFIGTSDLSYSLGLCGNQDDRRLQEAIGKVVGREEQRESGPPAATPEQAQKFMEQGFGLFQAPTDMGFMTAGAKTYLEGLGRAVGQVRAKTIY